VALRQINLTRFLLFFPEQRASFLEDSGIFEFDGLGNGAFLLRPFGVHFHNDDQFSVFLVRDFNQVCNCPPAISTRICSLAG